MAAHHLLYVKMQQQPATTIVQLQHMREMQMADFLRVTSLVHAIQQWLRGRLAVARTIGLSRKIWHNSRVRIPPHNMPVCSHHTTDCRYQLC